MSPITTLAARIEVLLSSCSISLALHLFLLLYVQSFFVENFCLFSIPCLGLWHTVISASLVPILLCFSLKICILHWFFFFLIKISMRSTLSVFKMNVYQNVPLTKTYLQPSLSFLLSHNSCETLHTCCFKFVSFGPSGSFLISLYWIWKTVFVFL